MQRTAELGEKIPNVQVTILTALDGFSGRKHEFDPLKALDKQVEKLCTTEDWQVDTRHGDETSPVLMHGSTGFIVSDVELLRISGSEEFRLTGDAEEAEKCVAELSKDPVDVRAVEAIAHNARPESRFLAEAVKQGALPRLWELRPKDTNPVEWEAVLSAICALIDDDKAQELVLVKLKERRSFPLLELCLIGLEARPTTLTVSYCLGLLRHVLSAGDVGLSAIYRTETELRIQNSDVSFARDVVELAVEAGHGEAVQLMNDAVAQCSQGSQHIGRFVQEIRTEAQQLDAEDILEFILGEMPPVERCRTAINFCVNARLRTMSQQAGLIAAQYTRETHRQKELDDVKIRFKKEQERLAKAGAEIRRLTNALREVGRFLNLDPPQLNEGIVKLCAGHAMETLNWRKKYTPLHLIGELGLLEYVPLLIALGAEVGAVDAKGRTASQIAHTNGHYAVESALAAAGDVSVGEMGERMSFVMLQVGDEDKHLEAESACCGSRRIRLWRTAFRYWRKDCCARICLRRRNLLDSMGGTAGGGDGIEMQDGSSATAGMGRGQADRRLIEDGEEEFPSHWGGGPVDDSSDDEDTGLGALKGEKLEQLVRVLENLGEEQLEKRLMAPPELGGLSLPQEEVPEAVAQIKQAAAGGEKDDDGAEDTDGGPKGKGKGPPGKEGKGGKGAKGPDGKGGKGPGGKDGKGKKGPGKGAKKGGIVLNKPEFKPPQAMKPMWWTRVIVTPDNEAMSKSVWAAVADYLDRMKDTDFGAMFAQPKREVRKKGEKEDDGAPPPPKFLKIITDSKVILSKEVAFKPLPSPQEVADALQNLDTTVLSLDKMASIRDHGCASDEEIFMMKELRNSDPVTPWALPESYLWAISQVQMFRPRLKCLMTITAYKDHLEPVHQDLEEIRLMCQTIRSSKAVKEYLACILACGNYLNGGTNRGQADGYEIEQIGKLHLVKDANNTKDLRYWLNTALSPNGCFADIGEKLLSDLECLSSHIRRRMTKSQDGATMVSKKVKGSVDDLGGAVQKLRQEFQEQDELLQACLQSGDLDAVDPFRLDLPEMYEEGRNRFDHVTEVLEATKAEFKRVQAYFLYTSKSDEFFLLWDDALFGKDILEMPTKAKTVSPSFCMDLPIKYTQFVSLWDMTEKPKAARPKREAKKKTDRSATKDVEDATEQPAGQADAEADATQTPRKDGDETQIEEKPKKKEKEQGDAKAERKKREVNKARLRRRMSQAVKPDIGKILVALAPSPVVTPRGNTADSTAEAEPMSQLLLPGSGKLSRSMVSIVEAETENDLTPRASPADGTFSLSPADGTFSLSPADGTFSLSSDKFSARASLEQVPANVPSENQETKGKDGKSKGKGKGKDKDNGVGNHGLTESGSTKAKAQDNAEEAKHANTNAKEAKGKGKGKGTGKEGSAGEALPVFGGSVKGEEEIEKAEDDDTSNVKSEDQEVKQKKNLWGGVASQLKLLTRENFNGLEDESAPQMVCGGCSQGLLEKIRNNSDGHWPKEGDGGGKTTPRSARVERLGKTLDALGAPRTERLGMPPLVLPGQPTKTPSPAPAPTPAPTSATLAELSAPPGPGIAAPVSAPVSAQPAASPVTVSSSPPPGEPGGTPRRPPGAKWASAKAVGPEVDAPRAEAPPTTPRAEASLRRRSGHATSGPGRPGGRLARAAFGEATASSDANEEPARRPSIEEGELRTPRDSDVFHDAEDNNDLKAPLLNGG